MNRSIATMLLVAGAAATTFFASSLASSSTVRPNGTAELAGRIGDRDITLADVDARWLRDQPGKYMETMQEVYDGRKQALKRVVGEMLVAKAAASRGMTVEQYVDIELSQRVGPVTDSDVLAFYAANADVLGNEPIERHRDRLLDTLERRARDRAYDSLISDLAAAGPSIGIFIDAPRQSPPVDASDPSLGKDDAPVTIVAFSDFQCPFCARVEPTLKQIHTSYGDKVRIVWKDFPLTTIHPEAFKAAEASHCAAEQERYWEFHDRLFANQARMSLADLKAHAANLGLDTAAFARCLESSRYTARVQASLEAGAGIGVEATPTLFINGRTVSGAQPMEVFAGIIDEELARVSVGR
jgi:predicted DsbA family dithiol-disulfide isomerase